MRRTLQAFAVESSIEQKRLREPTMRERQQLAISYAFRSTLLSNPTITIDMVRRAVER